MRGKDTLAESYTIRRAEAADVDEVRALWEQMADQHRGYDADVWAWSSDAPLRWREDLAAQIDDPQAVVLVAEMADADPCRLGGFLRGVVRENPRIFRSRVAAEVWDLLVDEQCRGRGIGRALMHGAEETFRQKGAEDVKFHVALANEKAIGFYQNLGYKPVMYRMFKRL